MTDDDKIDLLLLTYETPRHVSLQEFQRDRVRGRLAQLLDDGYMESYEPKGAPPGIVMEGGNLEGVKYRTIPLGKERREVLELLVDREEKGE